MNKYIYIYIYIYNYKERDIYRASVCIYVRVCLERERDRERDEDKVIWFVGFYGISTFIGYLMPNPFLYKSSVIFQTIQFNMSKQLNCQKNFYFKLFSLFKQF